VDEIERIRIEYASRKQRFEGNLIYSHFSPAQLFTIQKRQRQLLKCLRYQGFYPIIEREILEVGCGAGGVLLESLSFGATSSLLHGTDLLLDRLQSAQFKVSNLSLTNADGQNLPYASHVFDVVMQLTVFSSILDEKVKFNVAREMLRVLKPEGMILWYDFWLNPTNKQTRGIHPAEIRSLFPNCSFEFHKITLAPPIVRRIVPISWMLALFLENLKIFNSHYLVGIRPIPIN
jgi:SAM-dependent methyltransferase